MLERFLKLVNKTIDNKLYLEERRKNGKIK